MTEKRTNPVCVKLTESEHALLHALRDRLAAQSVFCEVSLSDAFRMCLALAADPATNEKPCKHNQNNY